MSLRIGLTGGIGSGKSTVAGLFASYGASVLDMDAICHELLAPGGSCVAAVQAALGDRLPMCKGAPDRRALRALIFQDAECRKQLEAILHPAAYASLEQRLQQQTTTSYYVLVIPLLVETGAQERVDRVLVVDCSRELQLRRVMQRDGMDRALAERIWAAQLRPEQRLALADDCITNTGSLAQLQARVQQLHQRYLQVSRVTA